MKLQFQLRSYFQKKNIYWIKQLSYFGVLTQRIRKILIHLFTTNYFFNRLKTFDRRVCVCVCMCNFSFAFKGFVVFTSLFYKFEGEHLWNKEKYFYFTLKALFIWDNQILYFQVFICHDVIECPNIKHGTNFSE